MEWWLWPIALFAITFAMGIVAVLAGVGGGAVGDGSVVGVAAGVSAAVAAGVGVASASGSFG